MQKTLTTIFAAMILLALAVLTGCSTAKTAIVERHTTDTLRLVQHQRDSIYLRDSVFVNQWTNGDTVFRTRDRWRTQYINKEVHDTIYKSRTDSIPVPYPVVKEVPAALSWWQELRMWLGSLLLIGAGTYAVVVLLRRRI